MLQRIELEVLATVDRGDTISEIAMKLDHSESYLSRAIADIVEKGPSIRNAIAAENASSHRMLAPSNAIRTSSASTPTSTSPSF